MLLLHLLITWPYKYRICLNCFLQGFGFTPTSRTHCQGPALLVVRWAMQTGGCWALPEARPAYTGSPGMLARSLGQSDAPSQDFEAWEGEWVKQEWVSKELLTLSHVNGSALERSFPRPLHGRYSAIGKPGHAAVLPGWVLPHWLSHLSSGAENCFISQFVRLNSPKRSLGIS